MGVGERTAGSAFVVSGGGSVGWLCVKDAVTEGSGVSVGRKGVMVERRAMAWVGMDGGRGVSSRARRKLPRSIAPLMSVTRSALSS